MKTVREPAVAGLFYPADAKELKRDIQHYLAEATPGRIRTPKALIAPHAGYVYSGPVAGEAYAQLAPLAEKITRVVILAPSHRLAFRGLAYSAAEAFETPLGTIEVDSQALAEAAQLPQVQLLERAFENEHALEVHLPFLQETVRSFRIVPFLVSDETPERVAEVLDLLWGGEETLIVISSDLSHYLEYHQAQQMDAEATAAIEAMDPHRLGYNHACGRIPVGGLLLAAKQHNLHTTTLDLRNSGDTAGPRDQVVGYGAYGFN